MNDFLTNFDDEFFGGWFGKPMHLTFSCKNKDMNPSYFERTDEGYKVTCRTVGISEEDVKIYLKNNYIHVEGKSTLDGYDYSTSYDLIVEDIINNIKSIKYKTQDGITIIYIILDKPEKKKIEIERIK